MHTIIQRHVIISEVIKCVSGAVNMIMNKMNVIVFVCTLFGLMTSQTAKANTGTTSCTAPPVQKGESIIVICDFGKNISTVLPVAFSLEQYPSKDNSKEVTVLDCNWINTDQPQCQPSTGYTFDGRTLRFVIDNASERHTGRYACKAMSELYKPDPNVCTFQLAAVPVDGSTTSDPGNGSTTDPVNGNTIGISTWIIVGAVLASLIVVAVIVGVLVFWYRRKRMSVRRRPPPDANELQQPILSQNESMMSRASEPNAGENANTDPLANSPQPKDADNINSKPADSESSQPEKQHHPEDEEDRTEGSSVQERSGDNLCEEEGAGISAGKRDPETQPQPADPGAQDRQDKDEDDSSPVFSVENPTDVGNAGALRERTPAADKDEPMWSQLKPTPGRKPWENEEAGPPQ